MRIDILLSNLLFGMTALTGAVAVAHLAGDILLSGRNQHPLLRKNIRAMLTSCAVAACLGLFVVFSPGMDRRIDGFFVQSSSAFLPAPASITTRQMADAAQKDPWQKDPGEGQPGTELLGELFPNGAAVNEGTPASKMHSTATFLFAADTSTPADCVEWLTALPRPAGTQGSSHSHIDVACASLPDSHSQWQTIETDRNRPLLIVGASGAAPSAALQRLLGDPKWRGASTDETLSAVFSGSHWLSSGIPPGLRIQFGSAWSSRPGVMNDLPGVVMMRGSHWQQISGPSTVLALLMTQNRRIVWTSLPAKLYGKLQFAYGPYWQAMVGSITAWLRRFPQIAPSPLPDVTKAVRVDVPADLIETDLNANDQGRASNERDRLFQLPAHRSDLIARLFDRSGTNLLLREYRDRPVPIVAAVYRFLSTKPPILRNTANHPVILAIPDIIAARTAGSDIIGVPSFRQGGARFSSTEELETNEIELSITDYLDYWRAKSGLVVSSIPADKGWIFTVQNTGSHLLKQLQMIYSEAGVISVKGGVPVASGTVAGLGGGYFFIPELGPERTIEIKWTAL